MPSSASRVRLSGSTGRRRVLLPAALLLMAACRAPRPDPVAPMIAACRVSDFAVRGNGVERDGVGRFLVSAADCRVVRDSVGLAVFDRLLFIGVPQTAQSLPMLDRPDDMRRNAPPALNDLRRSGWTQFITRIESPSDADAEVHVDLAALRRWLERNNLSRKFGMP